MNQVSQRAWMSQHLITKTNSLSDDHMLLKSSGIVWQKIYFLLAPNITVTVTLKLLGNSAGEKTRIRSSVLSTESACSVLAGTGGKEKRKIEK